MRRHGLHLKCERSQIFGIMSLHTERSFHAHVYNYTDIIHKHEIIRSLIEENTNDNQGLSNRLLESSLSIFYSKMQVCHALD